MGKRTVEQRFWAKVDALGGRDACWPWMAYVDDEGYGVFAITSSDKWKAHRFAYELLVGPIPPQFSDLDHECHTADPTCNRGSDCPHRRCVNPRHLEPMTHAENLRRGRGDSDQLADRQRAKTHCPQGHPLSGDNVRITAEGWRVCRACVRAASRAWKDRQRRSTTSGPAAE